MELFSLSEPINIDIRNASLIYYPNFFNLEVSNSYFKTLFETIKWQQDNITIFGKTYKQPRLTALYGDNNKSYSYSNITMQPHIFTKELKIIKTEIEKITQHNFTTCLLNLYRNGNDSNGWHSDDEKELGMNPTIASISFGAERVFQLKHKTDKNLKHKLILKHGSLLIMKGTTQEFWKHQIPKTKKEVKPRINLTFRYIK
ncbi:alpha-ketoglutarate-dependent dioxygenase AlkB [Flavobacteriaceae bacterium AU392]|nr:alpha-ketoglutarate-dependent dioxygenase AlkB [Flavobacteriaceae bacterium]RKM81132.1 alpha-ketoglutarate-dependent dioxygenase AlkB [Flavobacteriaceae bacterium AU392]